MSNAAVFTITYWGTTGTISDPLRPEEVTGKIVDCLEELARRGRLAELQSASDVRTAIERELAVLPFHLRSTYGGNTTSVEVQTPDALMLFDCGSGFRELGRALSKRWNAPDYNGDRTAHVLVTHPHMDHSYGTPFFAPYYDPRNSFYIWATKSVFRSLQAVLDSKSNLSQVYFPPTYDMMKGMKPNEEIAPGEDFRIGGTRIRTFPLRHPGGCLAFRLDRDGKTYVFASDHEQQEIPDTALAAFAKGADILYTEGQYTQAEYEGREGLPGETPMPRRGWGHSTVEACVATALAANVKSLHLGHRDPARSDADLTRLQEYAQSLAGNVMQVIVPPEGMTVSL
jgi:phosphoribosyl 1,2-cyclic phosphodiesterase